MLERNIHTYSMKEQLSLAKTKAVVLGVGGGGCCMAEILARTGVGNITLVDFDTFEHSNKNRQIGALDSTIGKSKVYVMADRIRDINPLCKVNAYHEKISEENYREILHEQDIILDAVDKAVNKIMVGAFVRDLKKTYITGGLGGYFHWCATLNKKSVDTIIGHEIKNAKAKYPCASGVFMQAALEAQQGINYVLGREQNVIDKIIKVNQTALCMTIEEI